MTTHPDDRADTRLDDDAITVTTMDSEGVQTVHREPVDQDGQPVFPPETSASVPPEDDIRGRRYVETVDDAERAQDPAADSARLLPDGNGYTSAVEDGPAVEDYPATPDYAVAEGSPEAQGRPVEDYPVVDSPAETYPAPAAAAAPERAYDADTDDEDWLALQGQFVDDPADAVRAAGERVEQELSSFRSRLDSADTEQLRTAFKQFRDLSQILH